MKSLKVLSLDEKSRIISSILSRKFNSFNLPRNLWTINTHTSPSRAKDTMHRTNLLILAFSLGTQARVLDRQASSSATTTSTSIVSPPSSTPTVIAGSCGQDTLQYCCPFVTPTEGESSVDFASACEYHQRRWKEKGLF